MADDRTIAVYDAKAGEYAQLTSSDAPDDSLAAFIAAVIPGGRVLDLGCGPATASAHMRNAGLTPDPVDASAGMVKLANDTHAIGARLGTFDDISGHYDGVWANFSLLHADAADLPRYLRMIAGTLPAGAPFHIGMKTGTGMKRDALDRRYAFVTVAELHTLLTEAGFAIVSTKTGVDRALAGTLDPYVVVLAQKA